MASAFQDQRMHTIEVGRVSVTRIVHRDLWSLPPARFLPDHDPAVWAANRSWLAPEHWDPVAERVHTAVQSWLIRGDGPTVLVDTGLAVGGSRPGVPEGGPLPQLLAADGVAPGEVDVVVCTHLHGDHVGWNTRPAGGGRVPMFPNARYLFARRDVEFFAADPVFAESVEPVLDAGQAVVWDGAYRIGGHLRLEPASGHTPGSAVLLLDSGGELAAFVGDVLHAPAQLLEPDVSSCFCHDPAGAARTRRRFLGWAADRGALLMPGHFGGGAAVEVVRDGDRFAVHRWAGF
jgi:glyoxylase-like metal-dependent hydrolase (beta-lactamase superfamily II)